MSSALHSLYHMVVFDVGQHLHLINMIVILQLQSTIQSE